MTGKSLKHQVGNKIWRKIKSDLKPLAGEQVRLKLSVELLDKLYVPITLCSRPHVAGDHFSTQR